MENETRGRNSNRQRTRRIAISGLIIAAVVVISTVVILRSKPPEGQPPSLPVAVPTPVPSSLQKYTLFFYDPDSMALVSEERELDLSTDITERLKQIMKALLGNSISGLQKTIPSGTSLYVVYIDDQSTAYLDFSSDLRDRHIGGTTAEMLTVETLLKTVKANFPNQIKNVQILIEGLEVDTIAGHIDISKPLALSPERVTFTPQNRIDYP